MLVIHVPHSSTRLVAKYGLDRWQISKEELDQELLRMTDWFTDELFFQKGTNAAEVVFGFSRIVVDPERFPCDEDEPMAKLGMGAIYTSTSQLTSLRDPVPDRATVLDRYYWPHHRRLRDAVDRALQTHRGCLIVDGHSFPSSPLPYEPDQETHRPEICLGTDADHTPTWLRDMAYRLTREQGFGVEFDRPFAGSIVPIEHYQTNRAVWSIMIEVRRDLYMEESTGAKRKDFHLVRHRVRAIVDGLLAEAQSHAGESEPIRTSEPLR